MVYKLGTCNTHYTDRQTDRQRNHAGLEGGGSGVLGVRGLTFT